MVTLGNRQASPKQHTGPYSSSTCLRNLRHLLPDRLIGAPLVTRVRYSVMPFTRDWCSMTPASQ